MELTAVSVPQKRRLPKLKQQKTVMKNKNRKETGTSAEGTGDTELRVDRPSRQQAGAHRGPLFPFPQASFSQHVDAVVSYILSRLLLFKAEIHM